MKRTIFLLLMMYILLYACAKKTENSKKEKSNFNSTELNFLKQDFSKFHGNIEMEDFVIVAIDTIYVQQGSVRRYTYKVIDGNIGEFIVSSIPIATDSKVKLLKYDFQEDVLFIMPEDVEEELNCKIENDSICVVNINSLIEDKTLKIGVKMK